MIENLKSRKKISHFGTFFNFLIFFLKVHDVHQSYCSQHEDPDRATGARSKEEKNKIVTCILIVCEASWCSNNNKNALWLQYKMWDNKWGQSTTRRWIFFPLKNIKYSASLNLRLLSIFVHFNGFYEIQEEVEKS